MAEDIRRNETTEYLRYHFTEDEKRKLAQDMAQNVIKARDLKEETKAITSQFTSKINEAVAASNSAAQKLESGFEMRTTPCEEVFYYARAVVVTCRKDTNEIIKDRSMTAAELQRELSFIKKKEEEAEGEEEAEVDGEAETKAEEEDKEEDEQKPDEEED
jgi:hypothetical protein